MFACCALLPFWEWRRASPMLAVLIGLPSVPRRFRPDEERDYERLLASHGAWRPDAPLFPARRYSVAEIEEQQRAPGATVEYVDDLSAALATSPLFRARMGLSDEYAADEAVTDDAAQKTSLRVPMKKALPNMPLPKGIDRDDLAIKGNTQRCGFSWNDAAAKCGPSCPFALQSECNVNAPKLGQNSSWRGKQYKCFADLPPCNPKKPRGDCYSLIEANRDLMCTQQCNTPLGYCAPTCVCEEAGYGPGAEIEDEPKLQKAKNMTEKTADKVAQVRKEALHKPGLPACRWKPGGGCTNSTPYECVDTGKCSAKNWFEDSSCETPCLHESLLPAPPYSALWRPGPMHPPWADGTKLPHYEHENMKDQLKFIKKTSHGNILMSKACKLKTNVFVGVSLFSPNYEKKARRLLASCERVTVCCKATLLPPDAFGPGAPEGSEEFRFRTIAIKPAFILSQLKATQQPVAFMDVDLEFHQYPWLFTPGGWPEGGRDVALFNYWGNETNITNRNTPNTGSGVAFFNQTLRSKKLLVAWAEAMAYKPNQKAPDDQVLDKLLVEGKWLARASFGWLPAAYMRNIPAYYRGVDCVIDHDHGNPPGLLKHSTIHPQLPPARAANRAATKTLVVVVVPFRSPSPHPPSPSALPCAAGHGV